MAYFKDLTASAKQMRGVFKTMKVQFEGWKSAKAAGPGHKEVGLKSVKEAKTQFSEAKKLIDGFTKKEKAVAATHQLVTRGVK